MISATIRAATLDGEIAALATRRAELDAALAAPPRNDFPKRAAAREELAHVASEIARLDVERQALAADVYAEALAALYARRDALSAELDAALAAHTAAVAAALGPALAAARAEGARLMEAWAALGATRGPLSRYDAIEFNSAMRELHLWIGADVFARHALDSALGTLARESAPPAAA